MPVKSKVEISQKFGAFSEYMNFKGGQEKLAQRLHKIFEMNRQNWQEQV